MRKTKQQTTTITTKDQQTAIHATSMIRAVASTINAVKNSRMIESRKSFEKKEERKEKGQKKNEYLFLKKK